MEYDLPIFKIIWIPIQLKPSFVWMCGNRKKEIILKILRLNI